MSEKNKILVIDDDPLNLDLIEDYLSDLDYELLLHESSVEGWQKLEEMHKEICLILLDRMMPGMDGIEFMGKVKAHPDISNIPVIMQTASGSQEAVQEGVEAGVFYYLIKPFNQELLFSLANSALKEFKDESDLRGKLKNFENILPLIDNCEITFRTMDEAVNLCMLLSMYYPNPEDVLMGIRELLFNAVEHGNLAISYDEKTKLLEEENWKQEVHRREELPEYRDRRVKVSYVKTESKISLKIADEGNGFDWRKRMELQDDILSQTHGRGIPMCKHMFFDELEYNEKGNEVTAIINL